MIDQRKRPFPWATVTLVLRVLRQIWPRIGNLFRAPDIKGDITGVDHLDDRLRRDVGLPPRHRRQRPYPQHFKPPPFL